MFPSIISARAHRSPELRLSSRRRATRRRRTSLPSSLFDRNFHHRRFPTIYPGSIGRYRRSVSSTHRSRSGWPSARRPRSLWLPRATSRRFVASPGMPRADSSVSGLRTSGLRHGWGIQQRSKQPRAGAMCFLSSKKAPSSRAFASAKVSSTVRPWTRPGATWSSCVAWPSEASSSMIQLHRTIPSNDVIPWRSSRVRG